MSQLYWYPGHEILIEDIVRAENCYLYDGQGKRYVDLESGVWCTCLGQGHPRIVRVMAEQAARIAHTGFNYTCRVVEEAARELLALADFDNGRCVFLCSGSEAVEYGVRVAQAVSVRPLMMTMADSYFGAYGSACRKEADEWYIFDWMQCRDCPFPKECGEGCEHWEKIPFSRVGGFLFEPGSSSGLVRFPPGKLIRGIADTVKRNGGLILINEVTTGTGQTGEWFGYQHYDISPDIIALGKGIGNGYPVSAALFGEYAVGKLGEEPINYAQSHQNDPLGAAVAREVVRTIQEEKLIERCREISQLLMNGLEGIKARSGRIKDVRGRGLMIAVELDDDTENSFTIEVHRELIRRGFIVGRRPGVNVLRLDPSLTIERGEVEEFLGVLEEALKAIEN